MRNVGWPCKCCGKEKNNGNTYCPKCFEFRDIALEEKRKLRMEWENKYKDFIEKRMKQLLKREE